MKKLIVACGSGVATSQTVASKISSMFEDDNIACEVLAVDYKSIENELPSADIYLYVAKPDDEVLAMAADYYVAVFPGIPFITGMGRDELYAQIVEAVQS